MILSACLSQAVSLLEQVTGDADITEVVETTSIRMIALNVSVVQNLLIKY